MTSTLKKNSLDGLAIVAQADIPTPLGPMTALATEAGLAVLWFEAQERFGLDSNAPLKPRHPHLLATRRWLDAYWAGATTPDNELTLDLHGSTFQRAVWQQLRAIGFGHTKSYGEVAKAVGGGAVPRATGTACGRNPVGVIVPCHRVIGANGSLTGFAGGLHRKEKLLQHEGALLL
jgi:methylated-DNA-[protein]-cysteine S-methyltransferase